jgi:hypothetical protein
MMDEINLLMYVVISFGKWELKREEDQWEWLKKGD